MFGLDTILLLKSNPLKRYKTIDVIIFNVEKAIGIVVSSLLLLKVQSDTSSTRGNNTLRNITNEVPRIFFITWIAYPSNFNLNIFSEFYLFSLINRKTKIPIKIT